jgi:hypothetical protein
MFSCGYFLKMLFYLKMYQIFLIFLISAHQNDLKIQKKIEVKKKIKNFQILKKMFLKHKNK